MFLPKREKILNQGKVSHAYNIAYNSYNQLSTTSLHLRSTPDHPQSHVISNDLFVDYNREVKSSDGCWPIMNIFIVDLHSVMHAVEAVASWWAADIAHYTRESSRAWFWFIFIISTSKTFRLQNFQLRTLYSKKFNFLIN